MRYIIRKMLDQQELFWTNDGAIVQDAMIVIGIVIDSIHKE